MSENNQLTIKQAFENDDVKRKFNEMLGKKAPGFMVSVINIVSNNKLLAEADRNSILFAAATAATLDLPVNENLGFAYILPYKNNKTGEVKAQFQIGYKGFIQLAQKSGQFKTISASPIYEGQLISENPLTGYQFDFSKKISDKIIGFAGYFELLNGFQKTLYMTVDELKGHGMKYSQNYKKYGTGLWAENFEAMAIKTVLKLLLSKYAPLSIEMQKAVITDQSIVKDWDGQNVEYDDNDNTPVKLEEVVEAKERDRVTKHIENAKTSEELDQAYDYIAELAEDDEIRIAFVTKHNQLKQQKGVK
jgi:recombination protein RecT